MRQIAEDVLRQRLCRWTGCCAIFFICRRCDRGQCYCSNHCRFKARREQRRAANHRHRKTLEGRLDQRDRQRAYRKRVSALSVMDQGSNDEHFTGIIASPVINADIHAYMRRKISDPGTPCCCICGRSSRFVDPFH
jgi:hypothetical protein